MSDRNALVALSVGSLALSRTYHGAFSTAWLVFSSVSLVMYLAFLLLDALADDEESK